MADDADHDAGRRSVPGPAARTRSRPDGDLVLRREHVRRVGFYVVVERPDDPEHRTRRSSPRPTAARPGRGRRATPAPGTTCTAISCLPGHDDLLRRSAAAARSSRRPTSSTWTAATSGTTNMLNSVTLPEHDVLHRGRPERHGRHLQRHDVDGDHRQRRHGHARRRRRATGTSSATRPASRASRSLTTTGGTRLDAAGRRRHDAADERHLLPEHEHVLRGRQRPGTILKTTNGGQTWLAATSGTTHGPERHRVLLGDGVRRGRRGRERRGHRPLHDRRLHLERRHADTGTQALNGVACPRPRPCLAVGAAGTVTQLRGRRRRRGSPGTSGTTNALNAVACPSSDACYAVGRRGGAARSSSHRRRQRPGRRRRAARPTR